MIAKIIEYSARNKFIIFLMVIFLCVWGYWALTKTPLDAIPDLSDTQVIIFTDWAGRSPDLVEDQITYPITSTLLAAPKVQAVRGFSFLGSSFIYVIFEEGTNIYWARSRVLEYLQSVKGKLPADVNPVLGPDATSVGWGFSYAVVDEKSGHDLSQLRSMQDWNIKLALESVPGVSQVASVGGFVKQYQIAIDPNRLSAYNVSLMKLMEAVRKSNNDVEGRVLELSGVEYMVRGRGYIKSVRDLENIAVGTNGVGTPIFLRDVARVQLGPEIRRGLVDLDGKGEVAGGIVVVRFGENVLSVIERVKEKIRKDIQPSLPEGVKIVTTYDRSDLIHRSIDTLKEEIIKLAVAVSVVCLIFLFHLPSALVVILTLPIAIIISFICMYYLGVTSNIMSLSGIAIAIGAMVDASIIMVENAHKKLEEWEATPPESPPYKGGEIRGGKSRIDVVIDAAKEVGPSLFFSLLVITVGFLPVFTLQAQAGRLFKPLAYTKTFAMLFSSFLAITLTPVLMTLFIRGNIRPEEKNPVSRILHKLYEPVARFALRFKMAVIVVAVIIMGLTVIPYKKLGSEFMPPLYEGTLFYMPVTVPAASISVASQLLQMQDKILKQFPEVSQVFGKAGRAETATDPAPLEMFETVVNLKPEKEWRKGMDVEKLKNEMNDALQIPGVANSFTMPIKARLDMLATGIRTPVGVKVMGPKLDMLEKISTDVENAFKDVKGTRSAYAERVTTGYFLDIKPKREEIARYGLSMDDVQSVVASALGGMNLTTTVEGRERYPVNVRYARELRNDVERIKRIFVPVSLSGDTSGMQGGSKPGSIAHIPLGELADVGIVKGPTQIKSEEGLLANYVFVDFSGRDVGGYVEEAKNKVASAVKLPEGYRLQWSGEYEYLVKTHERLKLVIPLTVLIIFVLIYFNTKSVTKTMIVLLAVPFSLVGSFWLLYILNYNMSIAVWVGIIALAGLDAETGVVMLLYLDLAYEQWKKEGKLKGIDDLKEAVMHGAVKRIRPKIMTVSVILAGLIPIMFSHGTGADVMKRIAAPMVGGVITSTILELIIYPAIYMIWKGREFKKQQSSAS
ncbi:MAG: CusA/CzcA family heavy metal efflux RND transporter [Nitrospirae bacterium]|nr:CusA/CzcA family heavy metal efflux RND transporter [Nitrospirota bacterium]MCL5422303.1 CusA/CzcA family heavy metal efflux RND transporter [Nitrospirota bacterium]